MDVDVLVLYTINKRIHLSSLLLLEIKKPKGDISSTKILELIDRGADLNYKWKTETPIMCRVTYKTI